MMPMQILGHNLAEIDILGKALGSKMKPMDKSLNEPPNKLNASVFEKVQSPILNQYFSVSSHPLLQDERSLVRIPQLQ